MIEICCGSYEDGMKAYHAGAKRVELNSALFLGGLTPTLGSLRLLKKMTDLKIIGMVRPRGGGFCYSEMEYRQMIEDCQLLIENGADGIAFGFLNNDRCIDIRRSASFIKLIHEYHKEAVFHRAIDCAEDIDAAFRNLIDLGIDRILTSGGRPTALAGKDTLRYLVDKYGESVEILAGSGINSDNVKELIETTGIQQIHASCKEINLDETAIGRHVSFSYYPDDSEGYYESVSEKKVKSLLKSCCGNIKDDSPTLSYR